MIIVIGHHSCLMKPMKLFTWQLIRWGEENCTLKKQARRACKLMGEGFLPSHIAEPRGPGLQQEILGNMTVHLRIQISLKAHIFRKYITDSLYSSEFLLVYTTWIVVLIVAYGMNSVFSQRSILKCGKGLKKERLTSIVNSVDFC